MPAVADFIDRVRGAFRRREEKSATDYNGLLYQVARGGKKLPDDDLMIQAIREAGKTEDEFAAEAAALSEAIAAERVAKGLPDALAAVKAARVAAAAEEAAYLAAKKALEDTHQAEATEHRKTVGQAEAVLKRCQDAQATVANMSPPDLLKIRFDAAAWRSAVARRREDIVQVIHRHEVLLAQAQEKLARVPNEYHSEAERKDLAKQVASYEAQIGRDQAHLETLRAIEADFTGFNDSIRELRHGAVRSPIEWASVLEELRQRFADLRRRADTAHVRPVEVGG